MCRVQNRSPSMIGPFAAPALLDVMVAGWMLEMSASGAAATAKGAKARNSAPRSGSFFVFIGSMLGPILFRPSLLTAQTIAGLYNIISRPDLAPVLPGLKAA